jgi:hypothetical protein
MSAQELFASLRVELTEDPRQTAAILSRFADAWAEMLDKVGEYEVEASLTINEGRTKRPPRPRKQKRELGLVTPPAGEAA